MVPASSDYPKSTYLICFCTDSHWLPFIGISVLPDGSLSLDDVHLEQAGLYNCIAQNAAGSKEVKRNLRVHGD